MRRSKQVQLVFLGSVIVSGCGPDCGDANRYVYRERSSCVEDWGIENCTDTDPAARCARGHWYGPRYSSYVRLPNGYDAWSGTPSRPGIHPVSGKALGPQAVARGGFGSTGRGFLVGG